MQQYLREECNAEYQNYLNDTSTSNNQLSCKNCTAAPLSGCLLHAFREVDKANMASAAVILGILPTSLSLAGSATAETGLLSLRRPVLAFLLGAGAPAVNPTRTFNYGDPYVLMTMRRRGLKIPQLRGFLGVVVLVAEYALAMAAVANLGVVSWQLCIRTICSFSQDTIYMPALWSFFAAAIHIGGATAVALRVRLYEKSKDGRYRRLGIWRTLKQEFRLTRNQDTVLMDLHDETYWFLGWSWVVASGTVVHIIFGTLVFSSILFVTTLDAVVVCFQLLGSTIVCRAILMFELSGMRTRISVSLSEELDAKRVRTDSIPLPAYARPKATW